MLTIQSLLESAIEDFNEWLNDGESRTEDDISDLIWDVADRNVPIYTHDLLDVAKSNLWIVASEPEL